VTVTPKRLLFLYLGRRGALARLALDIARALPDMPDIEGHVVVAASNELVEQCRAAGEHVHVVATFDHGIGALRLDRLWALRRQLLALIARHRIDSVIVLMSHIWTPLIGGVVKRAGARYVVVVHDAEAHPGDTTALLTDWLLRDAQTADRVVALSRHVADRLAARGIASAEAVGLVPLPAFRYQVPGNQASESPAPFGFLFFGRIAAYKGPDLLVAAAEILRDRGVPFRIGVAGKGEIEALRPRLLALDAEIDNRWLDDAEIGPILARYDAVVLSYTEASQSGAAAAAFGCGLPVVATPVGGLREQIDHERTGLIAQDVTPVALADAMQRMATDTALYARLRARVKEMQEDLSTTRFIRLLAAEAGRRLTRSAQHA